MNFSFNLVVVPPELHTSCIIKTDEQFKAHLRLVDMACWVPRGFKTEWPWGIAGECQCSEMHKDGDLTIDLPVDIEPKKFIIHAGDEVIEIDERV